MKDKNISVNTLLDILNKDIEIMLQHIKNSKDNLEIECLNSYILGISFCKKAINTIIEEELNNV